MHHMLRFALLALGCQTALPLPAEVQRREQGALVMEDIPEIPERISQRINQYFSYRTAIFADWNPVGGILISTRFGDTNQLHLVERPLGARRQLTFFTEPVFAASFPDRGGSGGFVFSMDAGGSEDAQLFHFDLASGSSRLLTDGESRNGPAVWSKDGKRIAYFSNRRNGVNWDIYVQEPGARADPRVVLETGEGSWFPLDWSPDDAFLLVERYISINESRLYTANVATGELAAVAPQDSPVGISHAAFSRDGRGVYLASDRDGELRRLHFADLQSGRVRLVSEPTLNWDVEDFDQSGDGRYLAYVINEGGIGRLHLLDLEGKRKLPVPDLPIGRIQTAVFHPEKPWVAVQIDSAVAPADVFVYDLETSRLERWTASEVGGADTARFIEPELMSYPTFDSVDGAPRQIPTFLYKPRSEGPHPVVVYIHGGPESQFRPRFFASFQYYLLELGFAVVAPNVRGSAGYGKSYLKLDNGARREDSVKDIGALLDWIAARPDLDSDRIVVSGGSYGGYMALASMMHYNERLLGGMDRVGISNFVTFLENTRGYRRDLRRAEYGDEREPQMRAFLESISPAHHAAGITRPLLIMQGLNDPRVPASESEQMVATIRENGGQVWYLLARDEGHGFGKKANRDVYYAAEALFLERLLARE